MEKQMTEQQTIDNIIHLHTIGLIDDKAFIEAIKKIHKGKAYPVTTPLQTKPVPLPSSDNDNPFNKPPFNDNPFVNKVGDQIPNRWVDSKRSPLTATYTPQQNIRERAVGIIKGEGWCRLCGKNVHYGEYHDCKDGKVTTGSSNIRYSEVAPSLTDKEWNYAMRESLKGKGENAVEVVPYTENRTHLPVHARAILEMIDEAWDSARKNYEDTKDDWQRFEYKNNKGEVEVKWHQRKDKSVVELDALKDMFNLEIDPDNQP